MAICRLRPTTFLPASKPRILLPVFAFAVQHQGDIVDRAKKQPAHEPPESPIDRLPRRKVVWQNAPATADPGEVTQGINNITQVGRRFASSLRHRRQKWLDEQPLLVGQIGRITLRSLLKSSHSATARSGPHPKPETHRSQAFNSFSNGLFDVPCN